MTFKDGYGFGGFSGTLPKEPNLSTPPGVRIQVDIGEVEMLFLPLPLNEMVLYYYENFSFYETFLMDCHFCDLPDFQSFEAQ